MRRARRIIPAAILAASTICSAGAPQAYNPPRAADGHPDFSGVWVTAFLTDIEPPKDVAKVIVTAEEAKSILARMDEQAKSGPQ
jgi:hypothetical protein